MDRELADATLSISSFRRPDHRSDLRTFPRSTPFPSLISPSFVSLRSGHTLCMTHRFVVVQTGRTLVWYSALTTRHFRCGSGPVLGPRVGRVYVVRALSSGPTQRYVFVSRIKKIPSNNFAETTKIRTVIEMKAKRYRKICTSPIKYINCKNKYFTVICMQ